MRHQSTAIYAFSFNKISHHESLSELTVYASGIHYIYSSHDDNQRFRLVIKGAQIVVLHASSCKLFGLET